MLGKGGCKTNSPLALPALPGGPCFTSPIQTICAGRPFAALLELLFLLRPACCLLFWWPPRRRSQLFPEGNPVLASLQYQRWSRRLAFGPWDGKYSKHGRIGPPTFTLGSSTRVRVLQGKSRGINHVEAFLKTNPYITGSETEISMSQPFCRGAQAPTISESRRKNNLSYDHIRVVVGQSGPFSIFSRPQPQTWQPPHGPR